MEQGSRLDSASVSAGHDTTDRFPAESGRDAAIMKMLTVEAESGVAAAIRLHEAAYAQRLYAETGHLADTDERAEQERDAFRRLLHTPLDTDADRIAYAKAVLARASGVHGLECHGDTRAAWMPTAYRNLAFGEYAPEAAIPGHQPVATVDTGATSVSDPIFAVIEEARRLTREHGRLLDLCAAHPDRHAGRQPEGEAHAAMWQHVRDVLLKTVPVTAEGCSALTRFAVSFTKDQGVALGDGEGGNDPVLALIARSPMLAGSIKASNLADSSVRAAADPIFAAIKAWEDAERTWTAFSDADDRGSERGQTFFDDDFRLMNEQASALSIVPTTRPGQLALLDFLRLQIKQFGQADGGPPDDDSPIWRDGYHALFAALAAPIAAGRPTSEPAAPNPDPSGCTLPQLAPPSTDPIFAAIEENRRLSAAWDAAYGLPLIGKDLDAEINAAADRFHQHSSASLLTTVPRTPAGCAALCQHVLAIRAESGINLDEAPSGDANLRILDLIARSLFAVAGAA